MNNRSLKFNFAFLTVLFLAATLQAADINYKDYYCRKKEGEFLRTYDAWQIRMKTDPERMIGHTFHNPADCEKALEDAKTNKNEVVCTIERESTNGFNYQLTDLWKGNLIGPLMDKKTCNRMAQKSNSSYACAQVMVNSNHDEFVIIELETQKTIRKYNFKSASECFDKIKKMADEDNADTAKPAAKSAAQK